MKEAAGNPSGGQAQQTFAGIQSAIQNAGDVVLGDHAFIKSNGSHGVVSRERSGGDLANSHKCSRESTSFIPMAVGFQANQMSVIVAEREPLRHQVVGRMCGMDCGRDELERWPNQPMLHPTTYFRAGF
jgi:hypothetical protein